MPAPTASGQLPCKHRPMRIPAKPRTLRCGHAVQRTPHCTPYFRRNPTAAAAANAAPPPEPTKGVQVNKCLAHRFSRREADAMVRAKRITINGRVALPPDRLLPGDRMELDGAPVHWEKLNDARAAEAGEFVYIKYWKKAGVVCTTDKRVPGNIIAEVRHPRRVFMVGRLDRDSTGLILLTNDGRLVNALLRSHHAHPKRYHVRVDRPLHTRDAQRLAKGVVITTTAPRAHGRKVLCAPTQPCEVTQTGRCDFDITLKEGRNRQIRRMCEALGYNVVKLHRTVVADMTLEGLQPGHWRNLNKREMSSVRRVLADAHEHEHRAAPVALA